MLLQGGICAQGLTVGRRGLLQCGALSAAGLLGRRLQAATPEGAGRAGRAKAVINLFLCGGPSQHDTFDPKPDAPSEVRGPFSPIATSLPGVYVTDLFPQVARVLDRCSLIRSLHHGDGSHHHSYHWMQTGWFPQNLQFYVNERPAAGSVAARFIDRNRGGLPAYVSIPRGTSYGNGGYLGSGYNPFPVGDPNQPDFAVRNLELPGGLTAERLNDRRQIVAALDRLQWAAETTSQAAAWDDSAQAALELVTSSAARRAFDLRSESPDLRDRYGRTLLGQACLLARRLVEAGVTYIVIEDFEKTEWDLHGPSGGGLGVLDGTTIKGPNLDHALSTLILDLEERGLLDQTLLTVYGEFGRTPRINPTGGRDHWGNVFTALLAGGGLRHGQVIGSSNALGERPQDRPLRPEDLFATTYTALGIDPQSHVQDFAGRPIALLPGGEPIRELF